LSLAREFDSGLTESEDTIKHAIKSNAMRSLADAVHPLVSAASILGARRFSALCAKVEKLARSEDLAGAATLANELLTHVDNLRALLNRAAGTIIP
jgi:HPt (histidine-containing phosphotransfer) domain-containing protein